MSDREIRVWQYGTVVRIPRLMYEQGLEDCEAIMGTRDLNAWMEEEVRRGLGGGSEADETGGLPQSGGG